MPKPVFLVMPQWQGSSSSRAMQISEGAALLREDLPQSARRDVEVPLEAGDAMGTPVARLSSVLRARDAAREALGAIDPAAATPLIVGGDCASSLSGLEAALGAHGADSLAVLWFDAHPDFQHPSTSPSGAASGMTLRHALGDGFPELAIAPAASSDRIALIGTRAIDDEEDEELERLGIRILGTHDDVLEAGAEAAARAGADAGPGSDARAGSGSGSDAASADALAARVTRLLAESGASRVYIHVDLDVLDPAEFTAVHAPVPFGLSISQLTGAIRAAVAALPLAGAAICEFAPADAAAAAEDLPTVLRILAALTSGTAS